jgi:mycoredoxin
MTAQIIVYSTPWCGHCHTLMRQLDREHISYIEVDIDQRADAAEVVMAINNGLQTVPTLVFPDGTALSTPSLAEVKAHLADVTT